MKNRAVAEARALVEAFARFGPAYIRWVGRHIRGSHGPARMRLLAALRTDAAPLKMSELGKILGVSATNVTSLVDALEADVLVARRAHPSDRRATLIELTPKGRSRPDGDWDAHATEVGELFGVLTSQERVHLGAILAKLLAEIERREGG